MKAGLNKEYVNVHGDDEEVGNDLAEVGEEKANQILEVDEEPAEHPKPIFNVTFKND